MNYTPQKDFIVPCVIRRIGGVWKLEIQAPAWLLNDIQESEQAVTVSIPETLETFGSTYGYHLMVAGCLLANAKFEWIEGKK